MDTEKHNFPYVYYPIGRDYYCVFSRKSSAISNEIMLVLMQYDACSSSG